MDNNTNTDTNATVSCVTCTAEVDAAEVDDHSRCIECVTNAERTEEEIEELQEVLEALAEVKERLMGLNLRDWDNDRTVQAALDFDRDFFGRHLVNVLQDRLEALMNV